MKTLEFTQIDKDYAKLANNDLQKLLADIQILYSNVRGFHWNVQGRNFYELHSKLESIYDNLSEKADEIAERILMLGEVPVSKFSEYIKLSQFSESDTIADGEYMLKYIMDAWKSLITSERAIISNATANGDDVTVAILTDYLKEQEKDIWMLTAYNSKL